MDKGNIEGLNFAKTIHKDSAMMDDCHNYGMAFGCDSGCPQLRCGDCPIPEENKDIIEDDTELKKIYTDNNKRYDNGLL